MTTTGRTTTCGTRRVGDVDVVFRAAGPADAPVVPLHGLPSAGEVSRDPAPNAPGATA